MRTLILAAGYAVRLRPLTLKTSKSMLPIGGRKIIDRIMDKVAPIEGAGSISVIVNAKHFPDFVLWREGSPHRDRIRLINDGSTSNETRLGAIRDMGLAVKEDGRSDDLLVIAGDNLFGFGLDKFLEFAKSRPDGATVALHDIGSLEEARNFGVVKIDETSRIVEFEEKPAEPRSTLIATGVYYFPKEKLSSVEDYVKIQGILLRKTNRSSGFASQEYSHRNNSSEAKEPSPAAFAKENNLDAPGNYISWLAGHDRVYGFVFLEDWYDIGSVESYRRADAEYQKKEKGRNGEE